MLFPSQDINHLIAGSKGRAAASLDKRHAANIKTFALIQEAAAVQLADIEPGLHVIWDDSPPAETRNSLIQKIDAFNHRTFPSEFERFTLLLQDGAACLKGGVSGMIYCDWLFVDGLWVDDGLRRRGVGAALMKRAEDHAIARGCHSAWLDTFQARSFYEAVGYELFGMLDDYPAGQKRCFLSICLQRGRAGRCGSDYNFGLD